MDTTRFAICVRNAGYEASLELRKLYEVINDADAAQHGQVRVVDESGQDYLYPEEYFASVRLPASTEKAVVDAA